MTLFERMVSELTEEKELGTSALEMAQIIKDKFGFSDEDIIPISSKTFKVLIPNVLIYDFLGQMIDDNVFIYDPDMKGSSKGGFKYKDASAYFKPKDKQGRASAGMDNEDAFEEEINKAITENNGPISVWLNNEEITNVKNAKGVGTQTKKYKKTDIVLERENEPDYNISLKKGNAQIWESADSRYKQDVLDLITQIENDPESKIYFKNFTNKKTGKEKKGIYIMHLKSDDRKLGGIFKEIEDEDTIKEIIFGGTEVDVVVAQTFTKSDFKMEDDGLHIKCKHLFFDIQDVKSADCMPVLKIRHDSTRDTTKGLRPVVMMRNAISKKSDEIFI